MPRNLATAPLTGPRAAVDPFAAVRPALEAVEERLLRELGDHGGLIEQMGAHLLGGGKRLRPALVLLSGTLCGGAEETLVPVAVACEIIHMATLVHDDLIDASARRRGLPTVHAKWGLPMAVLLGDHLFAKGFSILAGEGDPRVVRVMSDVVSRTCAGEIEEVQAQWDLDATMEGYHQRVRGKTGHFIAECCRLGAIVGRAPEEWAQALSEYGREVGDCFQVVDDLLDCSADPEVLGKPTGSDLRVGVYTLPVLWALRTPHGPELRQLLSQRPVTDGAVAAVRDVLDRSGALRHTAETAAAMALRAQKALGVFPDTQARAALRRLAEELTRRVR